MKLICRAQLNLVLAYRIEDSGEWVFVLCKEGLELALRRKISPGEVFTIEVSLKETDV